MDQLEKQRIAHRAAQEALIACVLNVIESGQRLQQLTQDLVAEFRQKHKADKRRAQRQRRKARQQPGGTAQ